MAKFSKAFLGTLLATSAYANENFKVASCNDDSAERRPALTIQVAESYYTSNLSGQEGFALADGFYSKTIAEDDLEFTFSDDPDEIILSYTLATGSSATDFSLDDSVTISFGGDGGITFQCRYSRNVSVSQDISVIDTPTDAIEGTGDFTYSMSITVGGPGGTTDVVITPNHNFDEIAPRLINCNVAHAEHSIYPIHSFNDDQLCFDKSRLDVMQSVFGASIEFSMRTFLFKTVGSSAEEQQQTISCNLHLDPAADVSSTEPDDCSCYSEEECAVPAGFTNLAVDAQQRTLSTGKQILYASYDRKFYQEAVDLCASHGAEIVLPASQQENLEVRDFLNETRANFGPDVNILGVFVRVANIGYPTSQTWVDARDNSPLGWDGDFSDVGGNRGIWDYASNNASHGFMEPGNAGTWKGLLSQEDHNQRECEVICELPSV